MSSKSNTKLQVPLDIAPSKIEHDVNGVKLIWPDNHVSLFSVAFFQEHFFPSNSSQEPFEKIYWTANQAKASQPEVAYDKVMNTDQGVLDWLTQVEKVGFCFVSGCPVNVEATEKLAERICFIRETHYGKFWDFTANFEHSDLAYSSLPLNLHTDATYFSDPIKLQMFHLLSDRSSHQGGHSTLADGFLCAARLKETHPALYNLLSTLPVPAHASGGDHTLFKPVIDRPIFEHDSDGKLIMIRFNSDDRGLISTFNSSKLWQGDVKLDDGRLVDKVTGFYLAVREWEKLLRSPEFVYEFPMQPGRPFIFDNQRVLHGRTGFSGSRRLCGAYINGDDYYNRLRTLMRKQRNLQN